MNPRNESEFYDRAIRRIGWLIPALGLGGAIGAAIWKGPGSGGAFLIGAAISYTSFGAWRRFTDAIGPNPKKQKPALYVLRSLALVAGAYVIIKLLGLNIAAAALGLLVSGAAAILELVFELIYAS
jgi:hypothetical protein